MARITTGSQLPLLAGPLALLAIVSLAACGTDGNVGSGTGGPCSVSSDCPDDQTCQGGFCVAISEVADTSVSTDTDAAVDSGDTGTSDGTDAAVDGSGDDAGDTGTDDASDTGTGARCGNRVVEGDEQCDDGNRDELDECNTSCRFTCGDGIIAGAETCDTAIPGNQPGACPLSCEQSSTCGTARLEGSLCTSVCVEAPVTDCLDGDGCCGAGCSAADDADCLASCGNGVVEPGETCDPSGTCPSLSACADDAACTTEFIDGSAATCTASCSIALVTACID